MTELDISEAMRSHAQAAVLWAREVFEVKLDYSEASLQEVEKILGKLRDRLPKGIVGKLLNHRASKQEMTEIAVVWGSYIGEVMRQQWQGKWCLGGKSLTDHSNVVLVQGFSLSPIAAVYNHLASNEGSIYAYYQTLKQTLEQ